MCVRRSPDESREVVDALIERGLKISIGVARERESRRKRLRLHREKDGQRHVGWIAHVAQRREALSRRVLDFLVLGGEAGRGTREEWLGHVFHRLVAVLHTGVAENRLHL